MGQRIICRSVVVIATIITDSTSTRIKTGFLFDVHIVVVVSVVGVVVIAIWSKYEWYNKDADVN